MTVEMTPAEIQRDALLGSRPEATASSATPAASAGERGGHFDLAASLAAAAALSLSAGYIDGFTFVGHGRSFASAMTGNMVLLGMHLAHFTPQVFDNLYPLLAFVSGVMLANLLDRAAARRSLPFSPHFATLLIEIAVLTAVACDGGALDDHALVAALTISTAMQNASFHNLGARSYNSVIMTGNLQTLSQGLATGASCGRGQGLRRVRDLGTVLASFVAGAALGAAAAPRFGNLATLAPAGLLAILALALVVSAEDESVVRKG